MQFTTAVTLDDRHADCLILPLFDTDTLNTHALNTHSLNTGGPNTSSPNTNSLDNDSLTATARALDDASDGRLLAPIARGDFKAKPGKTLLRSDIAGVNAARVLLVGAGSPQQFDMAALQKVLNAAFTAVSELNVTQALLISDALVNTCLSITTVARVAAEQALRSAYRFTTCKTGEQATVALSQVTLVVKTAEDEEAAQRGLALGNACGEGISYARELANLPGNLCTPGYLAEQAEALAADSALTTTVLGEAQLQALGAGALLAVGQGSAQESRLIVMEYRGAADSEPPHVLVGKGITFDTGGISLKPGADMDEMRYDMGGAASVFGAVKTLLLLKPCINVVAIIAAAENMPDGKALKPGDIITTLNGLTVEVLNTDAEGRLVLCDALAYAERYSPSSVIDIATLTGACVIALGDHASALYANSDALAASLRRAAEASWDRVWQMPLWEDYQCQLDSNFADIANIGGRKGGSITAACFLSRFAKQYPWAHLDVAGTAWNGKQGATGRPVGLLVQYLLDSASA